MDEARKQVERAGAASEDNAVQTHQTATDATAVNPGKMKVRVVLRADQAAAKKPVQAPSVPAEQPVHYEYRKDRIVLAVLSLLLIIGGGALLAVRLVGVDAAGPSSNAPVAAQSAEDAQVLSPVLSDQPSSSVAPKSALPETSVSETPVSQAPAPATSSRARVTIPVTPPVSDANASLTDGGAAQVAAASSQTEVPSMPTEAADTASPELAQPLVQVLNEAVSRASLNWRVVDLEPGRAVAASPIVFKAGESLKQVFFYTQLNDRKDKIFYYDWFLEGRPIAKVKVGVWSDSWRSYSSKQILRKHVGEWVVKLTDASGQVYAKSVFEVVAAP